MHINPVIRKFSELYNAKTCMGRAIWLVPGKNESCLMLGIESTLTRFEASN